MTAAATMKPCLRAYFQEPALRLISIQLKYGPWRDALATSWACRRKEREGVKGRAERAAFIVELLQDVCRAMDRVVIDAWVDNLGRNISHAAGPVPTMHRLGILKGAVAKHKILRYAKGGGRAKRLCVGREIGRSRTLVGKVIDLVDTVGDVRAPRTCREWVEVHERVLAAMGRSKPPGMTRTELFLRSIYSTSVAGGDAGTCCANGLMHNDVSSGSWRLYAASLVVSGFPEPLVCACLHHSTLTQQEQ